MTEVSGTPLRVVSVSSAPLVPPQPAIFWFALLESGSFDSKTSMGLEKSGSAGHPQRALSSETRQKQSVAVLPGGWGPPLCASSSPGMQREWEWPPPQRPVCSEPGTVPGA